MFKLLCTDVRSSEEAWSSRNLLPKSNQDRWRQWNVFVQLCDLPEEQKEVSRSYILVLEIPRNQAGSGTMLSQVWRNAKENEQTTISSKSILKANEHEEK